MTQDENIFVTKISLYFFYNTLYLPVSCLLLLVLSSDKTFVSTTSINISFWISSVFCRKSDSDWEGFLVPGFLLLCLSPGKRAGNLLHISVFPYSTFCRNLSGLGNCLFPTQEHTCCLESHAQCGSCNATQSLKPKHNLLVILFVSMNMCRYCKFLES